MRLFSLLAFIVGTVPAFADFSYTSTSKSGGAMAAMAGMSAAPTVSHYYYKGQKMKFETSGSTIIMDMDARTVTTLTAATKSYTVKSMDEIMQSASNAPDVKIEVKETGQKKMVNGFMASEIVMTMEMEPPPGRQGMGKMQMEMDMWLSSDVPGIEEMRAFHKRNADKFPWSAMAAGGNPSMAKAIADLQKKIAGMNGVPVEQIMRVKAPGMAGMPGGAPQMSGAQADKMQAGMAQARARLEAMVAQGGPGAAIAQQQLDRMGSTPGGGGAATPPSSGAMIEVTMDASGFSGGSVPDSVFAIPADYHKAN